MIKLEGVSYQVPTGDEILSDVSLEIGEGEFKGLLGKNGAGKTTLVDIIMGLRKPTAGKVTIFGEDPFSSNREFFNQVSYLSQDISLKDNITIKEFLDFNRYFYPNYSIEIEQELISQFELDVKSKIGGQSTGQKRRVQIVASLAARPRILIIDEITAVLDPGCRNIFFSLLKKINNDDKTTILLATNIVEDLKSRIDGLFYIEDKKISKKEASELDSLFDGGALE